MNRQSNMLPACIFRFALALLLAFCLYSPSYAVNVTIGWDPNDEPDLEGYNVYNNIGSPGPPYKYRTHLPETSLADPLNPMATLTGLKEDTRYFIALTAYDTDGNESSYSDDVCVQVVDSAIGLCSASAGSSPGDSSGSASSSSGGGGGGGVCFIAAAGPDSALPIMGPFLLSHPAETFFSILFLLLIGAVRSVIKAIR